MGKENPQNPSELRAAIISIGAVTNPEKYIKGVADMDINGHSAIFVIAMGEERILVAEEVSRRLCNKYGWQEYARDEGFDELKQPVIQFTLTKYVSTEEIGRKRIIFPWLQRFGIKITR